MSSVTVRNIPDATHRALKLRAAQHGRSTEAEIRFILEGAVAPKVGLGAVLVALSTQVAALFQGRILSFDVKADQAFGVCHASAHAKGNPIGFADCAIAAIAKANGFMIATRNVRDFVGTGIDIIDPWALG